MREGTGVLLGMVSGALLGGAAGYLYLTADGRRLRARLEPQLVELAADLLRLRESVGGARAAARRWKPAAAADRATIR